MEMKRRKFLVRSLTGAGSFLVGACLGESKPRRMTFGPYRQVQLGKTKIKTSLVGLGTGMRGWKRESNQTRLGREGFNALARGCFERGIRLFDAADLYGSHSFLAEALRGIRREDYVIVSKIWWRKGGLPEAERPPADVVVERFLSELETEYIDLLLLHCVVSGKWPDELGDYMETMARLKKRGLIRAHGVSCHSLEALEACVKEPWVDSVHARINPYAVKMDVKDVRDVPKVAAVLKALRSRGKAVIGIKVMGEGVFGESGERRDSSIRYVLESGCVDAVVVGFEKIAEVDDFAARVRKVETTGTGSRTKALQPAREI